MLSMLSYSESSRTDGRQDASLGHPDDQLGIQLLLSLNYAESSKSLEIAFLMLVDVQIYLTRKRTNRLQYSVCASVRSIPQGIVLRKLISI
jgi:hypothetical protein